MISFQRDVFFFDKIQTGWDGMRQFSSYKALSHVSTHEILSVLIFSFEHHGHCWKYLSDRRPEADNKWPGLITFPAFSIFQLLDIMKFL